MLKLTGGLGHICLSLIVDAIVVLLFVDCVSSVVSVSSGFELGFVEVLMAGELGLDSGTFSVGIVAVCGLLTAMRCV